MSSSLEAEWPMRSPRQFLEVRRQCARTMRTNKGESMDSNKTQRRRACQCGSACVVRFHLGGWRRRKAYSIGDRWRLYRSCFLRITLSQPCALCQGAFIAVVSQFSAHDRGTTCPVQRLNFLRITLSREKRARQGGERRSCVAIFWPVLLFTVSPQSGGQRRPPPDRSARIRA
jgi:hypothetical protein